MAYPHKTGEYGEPLQSAINWLRTTHEGTLSGERIEAVLAALDQSTRHAAAGWAAARTAAEELRARGQALYESLQGATVYNDEAHDQAVKALTAWEELQPFAEADNELRGSATCSQYAADGTNP